LRPAPKNCAALVETSLPKRSSESEYQEFRYFWIVARSSAPAERGSVPARRHSAVRSTMRLMPLSPTNMWCASSVSMKRQVRDSGSKPDSASASSWYLPSRSVKVVNMKKESQSSIGSLKAPRMRGLSGLPERRSRSPRASSRPSRPK